MKKIVAILAMFALVAGAAFAQPSVGGQFKAGATLLWGTSEKDQKQDGSFYVDKPAVGAETQKWDEVGKDWLTGGRYPGNGTEGFVNVKFGDAEMGGYVRAFAKANGDYHSPAAFAFMWWRPNEYFRIQIGHNPDADWGAANITGWGFNGEAQDFVALDNDSSDFRSWNGTAGLNKTDLSTIRVARTTGFYGGIKSSHSVITSLYPMDGLTVNIGFPWGEATGANPGGPNIDRAAHEWLKVHAQVKYDLEEVGSIFVTYEGQGQAQKQVSDRLREVRDGKNVWLESLDSANFGKTTAQTDDYGDPVYGIESPKLWLSFFGNKLVDGLAFDVGFGYQPKLQNGNTPPIQIGLGATYAVTEEFAVKLRVGALLAEKKRGVYTAQAWEKVTHEDTEALWMDGKAIDPMDPDQKVVDVKKSDRSLTKDGNLIDEWSTGTEIAFHILPYYKLSAFTVYLNAGIGLKFLPTDAGNPNRKWSDEEKQKREKDVDGLYVSTPATINVDSGKPTSDPYYVPQATTSELTWYVNPYIRKSVNGASLMAGVKVWSSDVQKYAGEREWVQLKKNASGTVTSGKYYTSAWYNTINWAIPIGVNVYF